MSCVTHDELRKSKETDMQDDPDQEALSRAKDFGPSWEAPLQDDVSAALKVLESRCDGNEFAEQALTRVRGELRAAAASELRRRCIRRVVRNFFQDKPPGTTIEPLELDAYRRRLREAACQPYDADQSSASAVYNSDEAVWLCEQAKKIAVSASNIEPEHWPDSDVASRALGWISNNLCALADQLEAAVREIAERWRLQREALAEVNRLRSVARRQFSVTDGVKLRGAIMQEVAKETDQELDPIAYLAIANRVAEVVIPPNVAVPIAEDQLRPPAKGQPAFSAKVQDAAIAPSVPIVRPCLNCEQPVTLSYDECRGYHRAICSCGAHCTTEHGAT
jgi:hypothetical protein